MGLTSLLLGVGAVIASGVAIATAILLHENEEPQENLVRRRPRQANVSRSQTYSGRHQDNPTNRTNKLTKATIILLTTAMSMDKCLTIAIILCRQDMVTHHMHILPSKMNFIASFNMLWRHLMVREVLKRSTSLLS